MNTSCCLDALGVVTALGLGPKPFFSGLIDGKSLSEKVGAVSEPLETIPPEFASLASRNNALLLTALKQIEAQIAHARQTVGAHRFAIVLGSSTSGVAEGEAAIAHWKKCGDLTPGFRYSQQEMGSSSLFLAKFLKTTGPTLTVSTACSSSAKVFAVAKDLLDMNCCDAVLVGGSDSLCGLTQAGFSSLELVAPSRTNPFSQNRCGINIGEGAALFLMTRKPGGVQVLGVGESSDAFHMNAPEPSGAGARLAMTRALCRAALHPRDIAFVHLHGTGTLQNDAMEAQAVSEVFGKNTPCASTKPITGHTLGAAGALGVAVLWCMLTFSEDHLRLPVHVFDGQPDPTLPALHLTAKDEVQSLSFQTCLLSNVFAFGGNNCAVILGHEFKGKPS